MSQTKNSSVEDTARQSALLSVLCVMWFGSFSVSNIIFKVNGEATIFTIRPMFPELQNYSRYSVAYVEFRLGESGVRSYKTKQKRN